MTAWRAVTRVTLMIAADLIGVTVVGAIILLAWAGWQFLTGSFP